MLFDTVESRCIEKFLKPLSGRVIDIPFNGNHYHVIEHSTPPSIPIRIENHCIATGRKNTVHFIHTLRLIWIVMKTVYAGYHIQTVIGKWKALAVTLNPIKLVTWQRPSQSMIQHVPREVAPPKHTLKSVIYQSTNGY